ncbi:glycoside hydrolase family 3 protein [Phytoactinopolyspora limicola]|uniref:glycoside hydrolase family 3 protein n=1 Tax=Phytoactinopolyspora limicola TaxID=2715536 RepID=UPI00140E6DB3|nr:glycoside hydrolase family 3 protein [Phytoactinopolyspora limicola]
MNDLPSMTLEEKIAQLFVLRVYGSTADTTDPAAVEHNRAAYGVDNAAALISTYQPGGVVYFRDCGNIENPVQVARLSNTIQEAALGRKEGTSVPVLIATDQEGGRVARMSPPATWFPSARALAAAGVERAREVATVMGRELRAMGIRQNYSPVADVNVNPDNPAIGDRSFATEPATVAAFVRAQVRGFQDGGVIPTVKHFPGHGDTHVDTHNGQATITHNRDEWEQLDLPPFRAALEAGVDAVMTGHLIFPALDPTGSIATTSHPIITGVLRDELGFDGVISTDGLGMSAARLAHDDVEAPLKALQAGADQLLTPPIGAFPAAVKAIRQAVEDGELTTERIDQSVERILRLKRRAGLFNDPMVDLTTAGGVIGARAHQELARRLIGSVS